MAVYVGFVAATRDDLKRAGIPESNDIVRTAPTTPVAVRREGQARLEPSLISAISLTGVKSPGVSSHPGRLRPASPELSGGRHGIDAIAMASDQCAQATCSSHPNAHGAVVAIARGRQGQTSGLNATSRISSSWPGRMPSSWRLSRSQRAAPVGRPRPAGGRRD